MNAYELANDLEGWSDDWLSSGNKKNVFKKHANMLRQQADENASLRLRMQALSNEIARLELQLFKTKNSAIACRKKLSKLKKER